MLSPPHSLERQQSSSPRPQPNKSRLAACGGIALYMGSLPYTPSLRIHPRAPQGVKLPAAAIPAAMAADNLCMAGFLAVLMAVPTRVAAAVAAAAAAESTGAAPELGGVGQAPGAHIPAASASTDAGMAVPGMPWRRDCICQPGQ